MKPRYLIITIAVAGLTVGCDPGDQADSDPPPSQPAIQDARQKEALEAARQHAADARNEFVAAARKKLSDLDAGIAALSARSATLKEDAKAEANRLLTTLNEKRSELNQRLDGLKQASKEQWAEVRAAFETALAELEKAFEKTKATFSSE